MRPSRFSVEAMLDAPDTTESRPGLRLRIVGICVVGPVRPARAPAVGAPGAPGAGRRPGGGGQPDPHRPHRPRPGGSSSTATAIRWSATWSPSRSPCPGWPPTQDPAVIGNLAALVGETPAQVQAALDNQQYSLYKPVPIMNGRPAGRHPLHQGAPDRVPRRVLGADDPAHLPPGASCPDPPRATTRRPRYSATWAPSTPPSSKSRASQGYQAGDAFGQSGLEYQYETELHGTPGQPGARGGPPGPGGGRAQDDARPSPGDNIVTNLDTNLQQVADNALGHPDPATCATPTTRQCNNNAGC